ncbi:MAG: hypothetical protein JWM43_1644 [Acidobacteriaceae bacterium]|nr:hypothetical protein [Acidobacteriaceae bacterium]
MSLPRKSLLASLLLVAATLHAQISTDLKGRITDPSQAPISAAQITATETATSAARTTQSSADGTYALPALQPGRYRIEVTAPGFARLIRDGVTLTTGNTVALDLSLTVGSDNQTINVTADAPLLQSETSSIQTSIPSTTIAAIPLNGRNFVQLAALAPGVALPPGTVLPRINGGRPRTNEYLFDGISALQPEPGQIAFFPIIDNIREFTIEADNVPAEFGRFNGGVVNLSTRSGSNQIHGSIYDFFRNENLNARNYFSRAPTPKPEYRRNQYGGTLGAPILKDKLFFFGGFQGQRFLAGITRISTVPTLAQRRGSFGSTAIYDPSTTVFNGTRYVRQQFPNNTINKPLDPAAVALLNRFPIPTDTVATANNYTRTANDSDHQSQFDVRFDLALHQHDRAFVRYSYFNDVEQPVSPLPDGSGAITGSIIGAGNVAGLSNVLGQQAVLGETHTLGTRMLNDLRLGYTRRGNTINGATLGDTASAALGIPGIPTNAAFNNALPLVTITGLQQLGPSAGTFSQYQTAVSQLVDTFTITSGRHTIKFGVDFRIYQLNAVAPPNPTGFFAFTTTGTNQQGVTNTGSALASFLLGQVDTFQIDLQSSKIRPRDHIEEYFLQDDWKLLPNLTLNLGARYTLHHPSTEATDQGAVFNLATQQLQYLGRDGFSRSARTLHYTNVAPRIGFTYGITPRTVVRGGFGIVFIDQSGITTPFTTPQFPFIQNVSQKTQDSVNSAFALSSGPTVSPIALTPDAGLGQSVYTANRNLGSGYVQQWNVAFQRAITQNLSLDVAYVGSHIVHVGIPDQNLNQLTSAQLALGATALQAPVTNPYFGQIPASSPIGGKTITLAQSLKPYPRFQNIAAYRNNTGTTNYNAFEAKLEQRLNHGVSLLLSYTHSKLIDDASSVFSSTVLSSPNSSSLTAADSFRPYLERDSSTGDVPNVLATSGTWQLTNPRNPRIFGKTFSNSAPGFLVNALLGGWNFNVIYSMQSGMPIAITQGTNNLAFGGFVLQRPNLVRSPTLPAEQRTPARFFDTGAFASAGFNIGNASRNPVRGPAYRDLDLALVKHTALTEHTNLELRAELFNVTNTPAFSQPNGSFGTTAFGSITSTTTDPRVLQLALRLSR